MGRDGRPLRPTTCQSVKMAFLALLPGVHTIESVILTDTDTQHALTLKYGNFSHFYHLSLMRFYGDF
jgi:hypothetical protein